MALVTGGCTNSGSSSGADGYITGSGSVVRIDEPDREAAPEVSGDTLRGGTLSLVDYRDQVVVLNVWASWCPPCRAEADDFQQASQELRDVAFVGLNVRDEPSAAKAFVRTHDIGYPSIVSQDGSVLLRFYGLLNMSSLPSTVIVDPQGRVAALVVGPATKTTLKGLVGEIEAEA